VTDVLVSRTHPVTKTIIPTSPKTSIGLVVSALLNLAGPGLHGGSTPGSLIAPCLRLTRTPETTPRAFLCIDTSSRYCSDLNTLVFENIGNQECLLKDSSETTLAGIWIVIRTFCRAITGTVIGAKQVTRCRLIFCFRPRVLVRPINRVERPQNGPGIEFTPCYRPEPTVKLQGAPKSVALYRHI